MAQDSKSVFMSKLPLIFRRADFTSPSLLSLLHIHHETVTSPELNIPGQETYALDVNDLRQPNIQLWTVFSDSGTLLGCGALKLILLHDGISIAEIKSMHTTSASRGQGVGGAMIAKLIEEAKNLGIKTVYLETGSTPGFASVRKFYSANQFRECGPFGDYCYQENSFFMYREVDS